MFLVQSDSNRIFIEYVLLNHKTQYLFSDDT